MRGSRVLFVAIAAAFPASMSPAAYAQDHPDLLGTWKGTSETTLLGSYLHSSGNPDKSAELQSVRVDFTLTLTGQEGRRVWGTISSQMGTEPWLGVIQGDGQTLLAADSDGYTLGSVEDQNTLNLCYAQAGDSVVAGCTVFHRE